MSALPAAATATDVVDALDAQVIRVVEEVNVGREITAEHFAAAHARACEVAVSVFLERLEAHSPETAARFRAEFLTGEAAHRG